MCACLVVLLHSYQRDVAVGYVNVVEMFFSQGVTRIAVPFFFVVFGFLFFANYENTRRGWCKKATARSKTLLLPYLTWSLIGLVNAVLWNQICTHPDTTFKWLNGHWWLKVLGVSTPPLMMYHFWFVRVLIIATVLAPIIYVGVRYLRWMLPLGCLVLRLIPAGRGGDSLWRRAYVYFLRCMVGNSKSRWVQKLFSEETFNDLFRVRDSLALVYCRAYGDSARCFRFWRGNDS